MAVDNVHFVSPIGTSNSGLSDTSIAVSYPATTILANDLIFFHIVFNSSSTLMTTEPSGFTSLYNETSAIGLTRSHRVYYKIAAGGESGTVSYQTNGAGGGTASIARMMLIRGAATSNFAVAEGITKPALTSTAVQAMGVSSSIPKCLAVNFCFGSTTASLTFTDNWINAGVMSQTAGNDCSGSFNYAPMLQASTISNTTGTTGNEPCCRSLVILPPSSSTIPNETSKVSLVSTSRQHDISNTSTTFLMVGGANIDDLIILQAVGSSGFTLTVSGFTQMYSDTVSSSEQRLFYKVSDGAEGGDLITPTRLAGEQVQLKGYVFKGVHTTVREEGGSVTTGTSATTITTPSITTSGYREIAATFGFVNISTPYGEFTGETGGDWVLPTQAFDNASGGIRLVGQIAFMKSPGTISGGTVSTATANFIVRGFALIPVDSTNTWRTGTGKFL